MSASSEELESLVVHLTGRMDGYLEMLKQAEAETKKKTKEIESTLEKVVESTSRTAQLMVSQATQGFKNAVDVMKGNVATAGEAMRGLSSLTAALPGPIGVASTAVLNIGALITDTFDRKANKAKESAREMFMELAHGAKTFEQTLRQIDMHELNKSMEEMVTIAQRGNVGRTTALLGGSAMGLLGQGFGRAEAAAADIRENTNLNTLLERQEELEKQIGRARQANLQLLTNPQLRENLIRVQTEQIGNQMVDQMTHMGERFAQRRMFRALHSRQDEPIALRQGQESIRRLEIERLVRQIGRENITDAQAEFALREQITRAQERFAVALRQSRQEALSTQMEEAEEKHKKTVEELTNQLTRQTATREGATHSEVESIKRQQEMERALQDLRGKGASLAQLAAERARREEENSLKDRISLEERAQKVREGSHDPLQQWNTKVRELNELLGRGAISWYEYTRSVSAARNALQQADPAFQAVHRQAQQGASQAGQFSLPQEKLEEKIRDVSAAYADGLITENEYLRTLRGISDEAGRLAEKLGAVQGVASGSAEAFAKVDAFRARFETRPIGAAAEEALDLARRRREVAGAEGPFGPNEGDVEPEMGPDEARQTVEEAERLRREAEAAQRWGEAVERWVDANDDLEQQHERMRQAAERGAPAAEMQRLLQERRRLEARWREAEQGLGGLQGPPEPAEGPVPQMVEAPGQGVGGMIGGVVRGALAPQQPGGGMVENLLRQIRDVLQIQVNHPPVDPADFPEAP